MIRKSTSVDRSWMAHGACRGHDTVIFYPHANDLAAAAAVCATCRVRDECLEYALACDERLGIWGGVSERGRARILRERRSTDRVPAASLLAPTATKSSSTNGSSHAATG